MDINLASPRRAIRRATRVQLFNWVARGATSVVGFTVLFIPLGTAVVLSLLGSFVAFLATEDGMAVFRYHLGLLIATVRRLLPLRVGRFLDWATAIGLLRTSGAAYQFRHRELFEWLTDEPRSTDVEGRVAEKVPT
jgi:hypothetical protein